VAKGGFRVAQGQFHTGTILETLQAPGKISSKPVLRHGVDPLRQTKSISWEIATDGEEHWDSPADALRWVSKSLGIKIKTFSIKYFPRANQPTSTRENT
jgi:hypothetical protein